MNKHGLGTIPLLLLLLHAIQLLVVAGSACASPSAPIMETITVMGPNRWADIKPVSPRYRSLAHQFQELIKAIVMEDPKRVDALLKANPKLVNASDTLGDTPLIYALTMHIRGEERRGDAMTDLLLQKGADKAQALRAALSKVREGSIHHYTVAHFLNPEQYGYSHYVDYIAPFKSISARDMVDALDEAIDNRQLPEVSRLETLRLMSRPADVDGNDQRRALLFWYRDNPSLKQGGVLRSAWYAAPIPENDVPVTEVKKGNLSYRSYREGAVYALDEARGVFSVIYAPSKGRDYMASLQVKGNTLLMASADGEVDFTYDIAKGTLGWSINIGPLMKAIDENYINGATAYLDRHPEMVNAKDGKGDTPLIRAVMTHLYVIAKPNSQVVSILLRRGADKKQALKVSLARYRNLKVEYYPVLSFLQPAIYPPLQIESVRMEAVGPK